MQNAKYEHTFPKLNEMPVMVPVKQKSSTSLYHVLYIIFCSILVVQHDLKEQGRQKSHVEPPKPMRMVSVGAEMFLVSCSVLPTRNVCLPGA